MEHHGRLNGLTSVTQGSAPSWNSGLGVVDSSTAQSSVMSNNGSIANPNYTNSNRILQHPGNFRTKNPPVNSYLAAENGHVLLWSEVQTEWHDDLGVDWDTETNLLSGVCKLMTCVVTGPTGPICWKRLCWVSSLVEIFCLSSKN